MSTKTHQTQISTNAHSQTDLTQFRKSETQLSIKHLFDVKCQHQERSQLSLHGYAVITFRWKMKERYLARDENSFTGNQWRRVDWDSKSDTRSVQNSKQFFSRNLEDSHLQGSYFLILSAIANSLFYSLGVRAWSCFCSRTGDDILTCLAFGLGGRSSVQQQTDKPLVSYCFFMFLCNYSTTFFCTPKSLSFRPRLVFFQFRFWAPRGLAVQRQQALGSKLICFGEKSTDWPSKSTQPTYEIQSVYTFFYWYCAYCVYGHCPKRCREKRIPCPESAQIQKHVASFW